MTVSNVTDNKDLELVSDSIVLNDDDKDGMADAWETANGLNPNNAADRNGDSDSDGFTNLEEYINSLVEIAL